MSTVRFSLVRTKNNEYRGRDEPGFLTGFTVIVWVPSLLGLHLLLNLSLLIVTENVGPLRQHRFSNLLKHSARQWFAADAMVKAYLRYEAAATFGVVASTAANVVFDASGKLLVSPALESVLVWNVKQGAAVSPSHINVSYMVFWSRSHSDLS
jgi:hypothetical protein